MYIYTTFSIAIFPPKHMIKRSYEMINFLNGLLLIKMPIITMASCELSQAQSQMHFYYICIASRGLSTVNMGQNHLQHAYYQYCYYTHNQSHVCT